MKIVAAGGGSGGHVTPVLSVINELRRTSPENNQPEVWYVCDKGFATQARALIEHVGTPMHFQAIYAGKLRRYHGQNWLTRLTDLSTIFKNLRDIGLMAVGFVQSLALLRRVKPDVVFTKGGFVCVPIGLAAALYGIPLVIHDSDTLPGLTNRLLARFATTIATGAPLENYNYPPERSHYVGIPVNPVFRPIDSHQRSVLKGQLGYDAARPLVMITGGGTGSVLINRAIAAYAAQLAEKAEVLHLTGVGKSAEVHTEVGKVDGYHIVEFLDKDMPTSLLAADIVVTRAGATTLLELAAAGAACIIVPNPHLTGGHQLKNALEYEQRQAATVIDERLLARQPSLLADSIMRLLDDPKRRVDYATAMLTLAKPDAARELAKLIVLAGSGKTS